jgi:hypothetical protein
MWEEVFEILSRINLRTEWEERLEEKKSKVDRRATLSGVGGMYKRGTG